MLVLKKLEYIVEVNMNIVAVGKSFERQRLASNGVVKRVQELALDKTARNNILVGSTAILAILGLSVATENLSKKVITQIASDLFEKKNIVNDIKPAALEKAKGGTADFLKESAKSAKKNLVKIAK